MKKTETTAAALALIAASLVAPAHAQESPSWRFSAYGTVGAVVTDTNDVHYRGSLRQSHGATKTPDTGVDSRVGAQLDYRLNSTFSAVGQVLAARRDGSEKPRIEWLYGQAQLTSDVALRVGRLVLPVYLFSDTRNVGFAQHWLRAPAEVYNAYSASSFDGAQLQWRPQWNDVNFTVQASAGQARAKIYVGDDLELHSNALRSLNVVAESGNWTYRVGVTSSRSRLVGRMLGMVAETTDTFSGAGVQYDDATWLAIGEYTTRRQGDGGAYNSDGFYITGGRHVGAWLPYLSYSRFMPKGANYGPVSRGQTSAVGVRWDVVPNVALKTQFESTVPSAGQGFLPGSFENSNDRFRTFSVAAEFIY
jgi:hypothetical protein